MSASFESAPRAPAQWFGADGRVVAGEVRFAGGEVRADNADGESRVASLQTAVVSPRLADIPRRIEFPDGVAVAVADNDFVDDALRRARHGRATGWPHRLESKKRWAVVLLLAAGFSAWAALTQGLPLAGRAVAAAASPELLRELSDEALAELTTRRLLRTSALSDAKKRRAHELFAELTAGLGEAPDDYRLRFYRMIHNGRSYPNAFALPDGTLILTDRLMYLADDDELTAVLAHELGHAKARHGVQMLTQALGAAALGALVFGDITGAAGAALLAAGYSRELEREADCFAYHALAQLDAPRQKLGDALRKLEADVAKHNAVAKPKTNPDAHSHSHSDSDSELKVESESSTADAIMEKGLEQILNYLSTHPPTEARANPQEHCP